MASHDAVLLVHKDRRIEAKSLDAARDGSHLLPAMYTGVLWIRGNGLKWQIGDSGTCIFRSNAGQSLNANRVRDWEDKEIRAAATKLNVSAQALAIRLEELGKARTGLSRRFAQQAYAKKKAGQVSYVVKRLSEIGGKYTATIVSAMDREIIDSVEASWALALKPPQLERAREYVHRQAELARVGWLWVR